MPYSPNVDYRAVARRKAAKYGLDPRIFQRQIGVESVGYSPAVISGREASPAGAQGIAQFMPSTARGLHVDPLRPVKALDAAAKLMAGYVHHYGNYTDALVAYNAGPGRVGGSLPAETQRYVREILGGHDPGRLGRPQRGLGGASSQGARPAAGGGAAAPAAAPAAVPGGTGLATLLAQITGQRPAVAYSAPQLPAFTAHAALPAGFVPTTSSWVPPSLVDTAGLVNSIGSSSGGAVAGARPGAGPAAAQGPRGKTLVIGDSLEVGTFPLLKKMLGGNVHGVAVGGKPSAWGIQQLRQHFKQGRYQNVVFDMGTNDATAADLRRSLHALTQIAGNARVFVSTVNSPFQQDAKNSLIRTYARNHPNVTVVPWHGISHGGANLPDHIHGDYGTRARALATALGYTPARGRSGGGGGGLPLQPHGKWNGTSGPLYALFERFGKPLGLQVTSAKRHNTNPYSGSHSDHDFGNKSAYAIDASNGSAPTPQMDEYAYRVMHALGFKNYRKGTPINVSQGVTTINGLKYQVIYRGSGRDFGGNHLTHVHVGVHRV